MRTLWRDAEMDAHYTYGTATKILVLLCLARIAWSWIRFKICERRGHDFEEKGYANPDSGAIIMECKRCDYSVHHQLY